MIKNMRYMLLLTMLIIALPSFAQSAPFNIKLIPDRANPDQPIMGNHMRFHSVITNTRNQPIEGLVAWISLVEIDPGNEQPVDLEDWSAHKAITGAALGPGHSLKTDWPMRLIKGGDYRVVVSVTDRAQNSVYTSPTLEFHVAQKKVLDSRRILPVAFGIPLILLGLIAFNKIKRRHRQVG